MWSRSLNNVYCGRVFEGDESKSLRFARIIVNGQLRGLDISKLCEKVSEPLLGDVDWKIPNEDLPQQSRVTVNTFTPGSLRTATIKLSSTTSSSLLNSFTSLQFNTIDVVNTNQDNFINSIFILQYNVLTY